MGNSQSQESRTCGLCYFKLPPNTPFLHAPNVSRRLMPVYPVSLWTAGSLDEALHPADNSTSLQLKMTLDTLHISSKRGCVGCSAILQCLDGYLQRGGFTVDQKCLHDPCVLKWLVGDRPSANGSLQLELLVKDRQSKYDKQTLAMTIGHTDNTSRTFGRFITVFC